MREVISSTFVKECAAFEIAVSKLLYPLLSLRFVLTTIDSA